MPFLTSTTKQMRPSLIIIIIDRQFCIVLLVTIKITNKKEMIVMTACIFLFILQYYRCDKIIRFIVNEFV